MSDMIVTSAGLRAMARARTGGPMLEITRFAVGSAVAYEPDVTDTSLRGVQLHPVGNAANPPSNYYVSTAEDGGVIANYSLVLDDSIGDFSFGEIGLYLADGTLFALQSLDILQGKFQSTPSSAGNTVQYLVRIHLGQTTTPVIEFETITGETSTLATLSSMDLATIPSAADANVYRIAKLDEFGRAPTIQRADDQWFSPQYDIRIGQFSASAAGSHYSLQSNALQTAAWPPVLEGRYMIRFVGGPLHGLIRQIVPTPSWTPFTVMVLNRIIRPPVPNGFVYRVVVEGTSGQTSPSWATGAGASVDDGTARYVRMGVDSFDTLSWEGSLGTTVPNGTQFELFRASSLGGMDRYINEYRLRCRGHGFFAYHH